jgi:hypothetical protein
MKFLFGILLALACQTAHAGPIPYELMRDLKVTNADCPAIDSIVDKIEDSLRYKGLLYKDPESMSELDRKYNAYARVKIWALRVGCANPNRYDK